MTVTVRFVRAATVPRQLLLTADPDWNHVQTYLATADCYGAFVGSVLAGVIVVAPQTHTSREVVNLAVEPAFQHQGIAKLLLAAAIDAARQDAQCAALEVGTGNSSLRQLALYQRAGFEMQTVWPNYFVEHYPQPLFENQIQCKHMVRLRLITATE